MEKHLENIAKFKVAPVIAINKFTSDSDAEIKVILDFAASKGIKVALADVWAKGGAGATDLAQCVIDVVESDTSDFKPLYQWNSSVVKKIETIATEIYGAEHVDYSSKAKAHLKKITHLGLDALPICIAKTQNLCLIIPSS